MSIFDQYFGPGGDLSSMLNRAGRTLQDKETQANPVQDSTRPTARDTIERLMPEPWWFNTKRRVIDSIDPDIVNGNPYDAHVALTKAFKDAGSPVPHDLDQRFRSAFTQEDADNSARYKAAMNPEPQDPADIYHRVLEFGTRPKSDNMWDRLQSEVMKVKPNMAFREAMGANPFDNFLGFLGDTLKTITSATSGKGWTDATLDTYKKMLEAVPEDQRSNADMLFRSIPGIGAVPGIAKLSEPIDPTHLADAMQKHFDPGLDTGSLARSYAADIGAGALDLANPVGIFGLPGSVWSIAEGLLTPNGRDQLRQQISGDPDSFVRTMSSLVLGIVGGHYGPKAAREIKGIVSEKRLNAALGTMQEIVRQNPKVDVSQIVNHELLAPKEKVEFMQNYYPVAESSEAKVAAPTEPITDSTVGTKAQPKSKKAPVSKSVEELYQEKRVTGTPPEEAVRQAADEYKASLPDPIEEPVSQPVEKPAVKKAPKLKVAVTEGAPKIEVQEPAAQIESPKPVETSPVEAAPVATAEPVAVEPAQTSGLPFLDNAIAHVNDMAQRLSDGLEGIVKRPPGQLSDESLANLNARTNNLSIIKGNLHEMYVKPLLDSVTTMDNLFQAAKEKLGTNDYRAVLDSMSPDDQATFREAFRKYKEMEQPASAALDRAIAEERQQSVTATDEARDNERTLAAMDEAHTSMAEAHSEPVTHDPELDDLRDRILDAIDEYDPEANHPELQAYADELADAPSERAKEIARQVLARIRADDVEGSDGSVTPTKKSASRSKQFGGTSLMGKPADAAPVADFLKRHKVALAAGGGLLAATQLNQDSRDFVDQHLLPVAFNLAVLGGLAYMAKSKVFKGMTAGEIGSVKDLGRAARATELVNRIAYNVGQKGKTLDATSIRELANLVSEDFAKYVSQEADLKEHYRATKGAEMRDGLVETGIAALDPSSGDLRVNQDDAVRLGLIENLDLPEVERGRGTLADKLRVSVKDQMRNPTIRYNLNALLTKALEHATGDEHATRVLTTAMNGEWVKIGEIDAALKAIDAVDQVMGANKKFLSDKLVSRYKAAAKEYIQYKAITPEQEPFANLVEKGASDPRIERLKLIKQSGKDIQEGWRHGDNGVLPVIKEVIDPKTRNVTGYEDRWIYSYQDSNGGVRLREVNDPADIGTERGKAVTDGDMYHRGHLLSPKRAVNVALKQYWAELIRKANAADGEFIGGDPAELKAYNEPDTDVAVAELQKLKKFGAFSPEEIADWHKLVRDTVGSEVQSSVKDLNITESALRDLTAKMQDYLPHSEVVGPSAVRLHSALGLRLPSYAYEMDLIKALYRQASQAADTLAAHETWGHGLKKFEEMFNTGKGVGQAGYNDRVANLYRDATGSEAPPTPDTEVWQRNLAMIRAWMGVKTFLNPFTTAIAQFGAGAERYTMGLDTKPQTLRTIKEAAGVYGDDNLSSGGHKMVVSREGIDDLHKFMGILEWTDNASHWGVDSKYGDLDAYRSQLYPESEKVSNAKAREQTAQKAFNTVSRRTGLHAIDNAARRVFAESAFDGAAKALTDLAVATSEHGWEAAKKIESDGYHWLTDMVRFTEDDVKLQVDEMNKRDTTAMSLWQDDAFTKYGRLAYSYANRAHVTGATSELIGANKFGAGTGKSLYRTFMQFKSFKIGRLKNLAEAFTSAGEKVADAYELHAEGKLTDQELRARVTPVVGEIWAPFSKQLASYTGHSMVQIVYKGLAYGLLHMIGNAIAGKNNTDEPYSVTRMKELITNLSGNLIPLTNEAEKGNKNGVLQAGAELMRTMTYDAGFFGIAGDFLQEQGRPFQRPTDVLIPPSASTVLNLQSDFLNELGSRHKLEDEGKLKPKLWGDAEAHAAASTLARAVPAFRQTFPTKSSVTAKKPPVPKAGSSAGKEAGSGAGRNR